MAAVPPIEKPADLPTSLRTPPHSAEAEQAVIGGLLLDNTAWDKIAGMLNKHDFYLTEHGLLFEAIEKLVERGQPCDALTVFEALKSSGTANKSDFMPYLIRLAKETPSAANIVAYAGIVYRDSMRRKLIGTATKIIEEAYQPSDSSGEVLIDRAEQEIFDLNKHKEVLTEFEMLKDLSKKVHEQTQTRSKNQTEITGLATGFSKIDENTNGLQSGDLIVIAGRPSMGKTSLALNIVERAAMKNKKPVAIFSLEMPAEQLVSRFYSSYGKINQMRIRTGRLHDDEWGKMVKAHQDFWDSPVYIDDSPMLTPVQLRARVRRLKRERDDLALVVVDYLQLMDIEGSSENRATEISKISRSLKALAKEIEVPVIALSQLNRNPESRPNQKPQMSDLRESGAIEQDADLIAMIYRNENKEIASEITPDSTKPSNKVVTIDVVKHRNGPTFDVQLIFMSQYTRFDNYSPEMEVTPQRAAAVSKPVSGFEDLEI